MSEYTRILLAICRPSPGPSLRSMNSSHDIQDTLAVPFFYPKVALLFDANLISSETHLGRISRTSPRAPCTQLSYSTATSSPRQTFFHPFVRSDVSRVLSCCRRAASLFRFPDGRFFIFLRVTLIVAECVEIHYEIRACRSDGKCA